jgi:OOP family OmpA-OmpF porin
MRKFLLPASLVVLASSSLLCESAFAQDVSNISSSDNFYVAGNLGQSQYRTDISNKDSVFQNLRFGWRWDGLIGPEIGYAYLGRRKAVDGDAESSVNSRAATIGISSKYNVYKSWLLTGHAGYLRSQRTDEVTNYAVDKSGSNTSWNNGWYGGLGIGYDVTSNVSLALNYDNYHLQYGHPGSFRDDVNVAAFSGSLEYRF